MAKLSKRDTKTNSKITKNMKGSTYLESYLFAKKIIWCYGRETIEKCLEETRRSELGNCRKVQVMFNYSTSNVNTKRIKC